MMTLRLSWLAHFGQHRSSATASKAHGVQGFIVYPRWTEPPAMLWARDAATLLGMRPRASSRAEVRAHARLERELQSELHESRIVYGRVHRPKPQCADIIDRQTELRMIEQVEKLRSEIQTNVLPRKGELLEDGEIGVNEPGSSDRHARRVAQFALRRRNKASRGDRLLRAVVRGIGVAPSNLVRAIEIVSVAAGVEGYSRAVCAIDQRVGEAGGDLFDER